MLRKWKRANQRKLSQNKRRVAQRTKASVSASDKPVRAQHPLVSKMRRATENKVTRGLTTAKKWLNALTRKSV